MVEILVAAGATAAGVAAIVWARRMSALATLIKRTKTSPAASVRGGLVEVQGTVEVDAPMASPFEGVPCVVAEWGVDVQGSQLAFDPGPARSAATRKTEKVWKNRGAGIEMVDFWIRDSSGRILVRATKATLPSLHLEDGTSRKVESPVPDPAATFLGSRRISTKTLFGSSIQLREKLMRPGQRVYALGFARKTGTQIALVAGAGQPLVLSTRSEEDLRAKLSGDSGFLLLLGVVLALGGGAALVALIMVR